MGVSFRCFILLLTCLTLGIVRSDVEAVLVVMLDDICHQQSSGTQSNSPQDGLFVFLNAANFSREGCDESMSFEDFRKWCALLPSVRRYLGSLLSPSDSGSTPSFFLYILE